MNTVLMYYVMFTIVRTASLIRQVIDHNRNTVFWSDNWTMERRGTPKNEWIVIIIVSVILIWFRGQWSN